LLPRNEHSKGTVISFHAKQNSKNNLARPIVAQLRGLGGRLRPNCGAAGSFRSSKSDSYM